MKLSIITKPSLKLNYFINKFFFIIGCLLVATFSVCGQRLTYNQVFAPSEGMIKPVEKPFRDEICLNGNWQFQPVALDKNFREGIDPTPQLPIVEAAKWDSTPIRIPSPWNVNSFADKNGQGGDFRTYSSYPKEWENIKMGWLRKTFTVPAGWSGKHILLHFEAIAGDAMILINGKPAGKHFGIFLPFDIDVTDKIIAGSQNELLIGVRKPSLFDKRGQYGRRTYQAGSFWGQHIAGIWQDVFLEAVAPVHITNVYIKPQVSAGRLETEITIYNAGNKSAEISVDADVYRWIALGAKTVAEIAVPHTELAGTSSLHLSAVKLKIAPHSEGKVMLTGNTGGKLSEWSPQNPNLYGLVLKVSTGGRVIDQKYTRFGWRQLSFEGSKVLLNGKPIILKGDSWHFLGIPQMTRRYAAAWFTAMRNANLNAVRLHAEPYPSFYMDVADEMGILVLDETAVWASDGGPKLDDPAFWQDTRHHLTELIERDRNHPSVFGWSVSNEVMPVVTNVMRNPPGVKDTLIKYYGIWRDICRQLDPSRPWISADGEDDAARQLPVYVIHYGGLEALDRGKKSGKPWGVGEAGNAYYGTPEQVAATNGDRAYESFLGRMEGVADDSYKILAAQRSKDAGYRSVFNMVWYGLKPLPLGLKDTSRPPSLEDGIYFTSFKEGEPGVQPERLGPYCTTLNPGYDPSLPLYQTWPLFDAIRDANAETLPPPEKWTPQIKPVNKPQATPFIKSLKLIAGKESTLGKELARTGVPLNRLDKEKVPDLLVIDGAHPPLTGSKILVDKVLHKGGTVMVWGVAELTVAQLNTLLPAALEVTGRTASSLLAMKSDQLVSGLTNADLYFSELRPPEIILHGLAGPLVEQSQVLLQACNTDWTKWNRQPEYAKTAMVIRSERERQEPGAALIKKKVDNGTLIVTTLPAAPSQTKAEKLVRTILTNAGIPLDEGNDVGRPLQKDGTIVRELFLGNFPVASMHEGVSKNFIDPAADGEIRAGNTIEGRLWSVVVHENGILDLSRLKSVGPRNNAVAYLSFWVFSPRSLEDLLIEPNIPVVNLEVAASNSMQVYLNGKQIINNIRTGSIDGGNAAANELKLHQGWNHFLVKLIQTDGKWEFSGRFSCNQPDFLSQLVSSLEKP